MNDLNPYSPPQSGAYTANEGDEAFRHLDFKAFKKLYYRSCNVNGIALLLVLGVVFLVGAGISGGNDAGNLKLLFMGLAGFYAVAVVGIARRTSWGRILGIVVCIISLINIPLGTLIGAVGLFAFFGAPQLFGAGRIPHKALKAEFKLRKANEKMARRS